MRSGHALGRAVYLGPNHSGQLIRAEATGALATAAVNARPGRVSFDRHNERSEDDRVGKVLMIACGRMFTAIYTAADNNSGSIAGNRVLNMRPLCVRRRTLYAHGRR